MANAPWKEFPELWGEPSSNEMYDRQQKGIYAQGQALYNQMQQMRLVEEVKQQATQDAIRDAVQGKSYDEALPIIKNKLAETGDVESLLKWGEQDQQNARHQQLMDSERIRSIMALAERGGEAAVVANQLADTWGVRNQLGGVDLLKMGKQEDIRLGNKIVRQGADGSYNLIADFSEPDGEKSYKPVPAPFARPGEAPIYVDKNDLQLLNKLSAEGYQPWKPSDPMEEEMLGMMRSKKEKSGGGLFGMFGGSSETPTPQKSAVPPGFKPTGRTSKGRPVYTDGSQLWAADG